MRRARVVVIALIMLSIQVDRVDADGALALSPDKGRVGDLVRGEQSVSDCPTYRLRWKEPGGLLLGTDSGSDGVGTVSFRVPDSPGSTQTVVSTCQASPAAEEQVVGGAPFAVAVGGPTSTSVTTIVPTSTSPPSTTRPTTSTTRAGPSSTAPSSTRPTATTRSPATATTITPARPTSTTAGRRQDVADCERQAATAKNHLVYQPARRMTVGDAYDVVVSLALDASDVTSVVIPGPDRTTVVQLRTAECTIEAELIGGTDFTVAPGASEQSFLRTRILTWRWQVSPNRPGPGLRLLLHLKPIIREDGRAPVPGAVDVHEAVIEVDAQHQSPVAQVNDRVNGFLDNPLAKFLLIPGGSGIFTVWAARRVRRRQSQ